MLENRRHLRFRQPMDVAWSLPKRNVVGQGTILNISTSGTLVCFDQGFVPSDEVVVSIDPQLLGEEQTPFGSKKGKVVWFRKLDNLNQRFLCGVQFLQEQNSSEELANWIEQRTEKLSQAMNASILNNYLS